MSQTGKAVEELVEIASQITKWADYSNDAWLVKKMYQWGNDIREIAENEIGYD